MADYEIRKLPTYSGFSLAAYLAAQDAGGTGGKVAGTSVVTVYASGHDHDSDYAAVTHASTHVSGGGDEVKLDDLASPDDNTDLDVSTSAHGLVPKAPDDVTKFLRGDATWAVPSLGDNLPVDDTTALVRDPVDNTKLVRIDAGAITTGTTRVLTVPDRNVDLSAGGTLSELTHASRHVSGGADAVKVDDIASPDDNTDLDVSTSTHGLTPKLDNDTSHYLRGDGSWQVPNAGLFPVDDTTSLVRDPVDNTKVMRIDVGAVATGTTRVLTMPDRDVDLGSSGTFAEDTHASTHASGGADEVKLDDLAATDDNTDLNVSTGAHGLTPKLDDDTSHYLRGDGSWAEPSDGPIVPTLVFSPACEQGSVSFSPPTATVRNGLPILQFSQSTVNSAIFAGVLPSYYGGDGLTVKLHWAATTATSGTAAWLVTFKRIGTSEDIDDNTFADMVDAYPTTAGTAGIPVITSLTFTDGTQINNLAAGEGFRLKVTRDSDSGSDTLADDAELLWVEVYET